MGAKFQFRIYVAGDGPNSTMAIANLKALCREHLADCHEIEIVDLRQEPERALKDRVIMTPLVLKLLPKPARQLIGNLSDGEMVLQTFDMKKTEP